MSSYFREKQDVGGDKQHQRSCIVLNYETPAAKANMTGKRSLQLHSRSPTHRQSCRVENLIGDQSKCKTGTSMRMNVYLEAPVPFSMKLQKKPTLIYDQQIPRWQPHFGDLGRPSDASYIRSLARTDVSRCTCTFFQAPSPTPTASSLHYFCKGRESGVEIELETVGGKCG